ncbi:unnamed protein product [Fusarium venenatum]|uniref:Cyclase n=1 Tax=Fusarium venenatum TaxID=56646 RepID=A0A2L2T732_9HYPO|nr:uncharacterized protein FVRRES_00115 [Fusarium venenatum]CEI63603.1 unnamed protein product [Fusarium venenatum]
MASLSVPDFDSLPPVKGMPKGCAWGVFDKDGKKDHLGCINFLTPHVVREAYKEARDGFSVSLNWSLAALSKPGFDRKGLKHKVISKDCADGHHGFDDEVEFNTQCSSQWDSLVHYQHQDSQTSYNGCKPTVESLEQSFPQEGERRQFPTLDHWHDRGGLVGRGVLLDYRAYSQAMGIGYSCFDEKRITVNELEEIAKYQGTLLKHGDILIIRTGFTEDITSPGSYEAQAKAFATHKAVGVEGNERVARWFWNKRFSAVASDSIAFEALPPYFLSLFGLHIGELWDLKALSAKCKELNRYSFLLTSVPINIPGSIGSPPNALAIF